MKKLYFIASALLFTGSLMAQAQENLEEALATGSNDRFMPVESVFGNGTVQSKDTKKGISSFGSRDGEVLWSNDFSNPDDWEVDNQGITLPNTGFRIGEAVSGYWGSQAWIFGDGNTTARVMESSSGGNFLYFTNGGTAAGAFGTPDFYAIQTVDPIDLSDPEIEGVLMRYELSGARFLADIEVEYSLDGENWLFAYAHSLDYPNSTGANPQPFGSFLNPTDVEVELPLEIVGEEQVWIRFKWVPLLNGANINWIDYVTGIDDVELVNFIPESLEIIFSEDFSDGLEGWTTTGEDADEWYYAEILPASEAIVVPADWINNNGNPGFTNYTIPPSGNFNRWGFGAINSQTRFNGWASISSDAFNNSTSGFASPSISPDAQLVSPVIDLSDFEGTAIGIRYRQGARACCGSGTFTVDVTTNDFQNFQSFDVQPPVNEARLGEIITLNITAAIEDGDLSNFQFRFRINEATYYWHVDDIIVFSIVDPEVTVLQSFYAPYFAGNEVARWEDLEYGSYVINEDTQQNPDLTPGVVLINNGGVELTNVLLTATITGPNGFNEVLTSTPITLGIGVQDTINTPDFPLATSMMPGEYTISYNVSSEQELAETSVISSSRTFRISEFEYARDNGIPSGAYTNTTGNDNPSGNYRVGTSYYMFNNADLHGIGVQISGQSNAIGGVFQLAIWDADYNGTNPETYFDGFDVTLDEAMLNAMVYQDFDFPIELEEGEGYTLYVEYEENGSGDKIYVATSSNTAPGQTNYFFAEDIQTRFFTTSQPMIRMNLNETFVSVEEMLREEEIMVNVFPNPSSNNFEVRYALQADANVQLELVDITGKLISKTDLGRQAGMVEHTYTLDGTNLNSGIYFYSIIVNGNRTTKKLIKN
jgi:hypothetical protein